MLTVDGLTVRFGDVAVLRDVALRIPVGTVLAITGDSGSGKTILLHALADLVAHDGTVTYDGTVTPDRKSVV